jgi:threonyl-tRNA synthetase
VIFNYLTSQENYTLNGENMKILLLHSDSIEWEPKKKAIKEAEETEKVPVRVSDALVVFTAVEKADESRPGDSAKSAVAEILKVMKQVRAGSVVIYPYAHLSKDLASPKPAVIVLKEMEKLLGKEKVDVSRSPFGWYKAFSIKVKGHPLAELSRDIGPRRAKEVVSKSLSEESKVKSTWAILTPGGKLSEIALKQGRLTGFNFSGHEKLEKFALYEMAKSRAVKEEPPHVKLMRRLELADYEPGSDSGNLRFYPKGRLMKGLLEQWVNEKVADYGAMEIESPIMYDYEHPALKDYLNRFPARQYVVQSVKKQFFLRFSACFGQFLMKAGSSISYRNLPLRMYELTRYSFRLEQKGELTGLRRLRSFTMPDMHTLCRDLGEARQEFRKQFSLSMGCMKDIGLKKIEYETAIRFTREFWKGNRDFVVSLARLAGRPVLIEMWSFRFAYFDPKFEFNFVDALDKASALSTVQIDHENAERYGIRYTDEDNTRKLPTILHCSPSGAIERVMYALLEKAHMEQQRGKNPILPLWLSPVQARLCPVSDRYQKHAEKVLGELEKENLRADLDDRVESVQKKIRDAEMEWIPYIVVIGGKERKSGKLAVRFRKTGKVRNMTGKQLAGEIRKQTRGFPFRKLPLPSHLTKRPVFVG